MLAWLRRNALLVSMLFGAGVYEFFARIPCLFPLADGVGPWLPRWLPYGLFLLLYFTFCRIRLSELRLRSWHVVIQLVRTSLAAAMVFLILLFGQHSDWKLVLEGMFVCFICPTAAAVMVVADKLGGSVGSLTAFMLLANCVTMVIIPLMFPLVEREAAITFWMAFLMLLKNVFVVLVLPLVLALLSRRLLPRWVERVNRHRDLSFHIWCLNLMVVTGTTLQNIHQSQVSGWVLAALLITPLFCCLLQFALGKLIGRHWGDSISAGQALGQKNTVMGIWLTLSFLNPVAAVAPGAYVLWQNLVNNFQIAYKEKHGRLTW